MAGNRRLAFSFTEASGAEVQKFGGKGAGLVAMTKLGLPVPPGFIITTGAHRANMQEGAAPGGFAVKLSEKFGRSSAPRAEVSAEAAIPSLFRCARARLSPCRE